MHTYGRLGTAYVWHAAQQLALWLCWHPCCDSHPLRCARRVCRYRGLWCFDKPWEGPPRWTVPVDTPKGVPVGGVDIHRCLGLLCKAKPGCALTPVGHTVEAQLFAAGQSNRPLFALLPLHSRSPLPCIGCEAPRLASKAGSPTSLPATYGARLRRHCCGMLPPCGSSCTRQVRGWRVRRCCAGAVHAPLFWCSHTEEPGVGIGRESQQALTCPPACGCAMLCRLHTRRAASCQVEPSMHGGKLWALLAWFQPGVQ